MARELEDWLSAYLQYTENSEPPITYHTWCGLSLLAGALQRKAYLQWGFEYIYANLFAILVGPSGRTRKGIALGIAKTMLSKVPEVSVAPEAASREAIIMAMKRANRNFQDPDDGTIKMHCSLTAFSEELAVLLGQGDIKLLANLTDWYDSKNDWAYETIGRGRDALQGLCLNLMGGTAPDWLQSMLPQEAVGGGFTSRVIFIVEDRKRKTVSEHQLTEAELKLEEMLLRDLERINQLIGRFQFTDTGKRLYKSWYEEQDALLTKGEAAVQDPRFAGYCERRATHLRKVMMLCSASRGDTLLIDEPDFHRALGILKMTERKMHRTFGGLGRAKDSDVTDKVIEYIRTMGTTTRTTLLGRFYRDLDAQGLKSVEEMLEQMKLVKIKLLPDQREKIYVWVGEGPKNE